MTALDAGRRSAQVYLLKSSHLEQVMKYSLQRNSFVKKRCSRARLHPEKPHFRSRSPFRKKFSKNMNFNACFITNSKVLTNRGFDVAPWHTKAQRNNNLN